MKTPNASHPSRRRWVVILAMVLAGIGAGAAWLVIREVGRSAPARPNVIVISIDTCRADHLGCYNSERAVTPNIDILAQHATLFENVVAPTPLTLPSHTSMLTGRIPLAHGVHDNGQIVPAANQTLAEILAGDGYATAAFVSSAVLGRQFGLDQGFAAYVDTMGMGGVMQEERAADQTARRAIDWLARRDPSKPFFLFVHFYDAHTPYEPPEPYASQAPHPYAGEIAFVDANIGRLLGALEDEGIYDSSVVIVAGDHGEMLGEHGEGDHGYFIYESAIKVPLIIKHPGQRAGRRVQPLVGLVDVLPSVCSIVGATPPADLAGRDISDAAGSSATSPSRALYIQSAYPQIIFDTNPLLGLVEGRWKFIYTTRSELYDLQADPGEQTNLIEVEPQQVKAMRAKLEAVVAGVATRLLASPAANDARTQQMLESLGYAGSGQRQAGLLIDPEVTDPKDMIAAYTTFHEIRQVRNDGDLAGAVEKGVALARDYPEVRAVQQVVASLLFAAGRYEEALTSCESLEALMPDDGRTQAMKGTVYVRLGRHQEARIALRRAVELDATQAGAYRELGDACTSLGEYDEAAQAYQAALALDGRNLHALNNLACLYVDHLGEPAKAVALTERAMTLARDVPDLMDTGGWALANVGRYEEAHQLLAAAVARHSVPETRYHLGWTLEKLNRQAEARREYEQALQLLGENHDDPIYAKVTEALERVAAP